MAAPSGSGITSSVISGSAVICTARSPADAPP
jgi:hypothetical protein